MATSEEKRKDWSLLSAWCENQADLEGTESWMCAPEGERQKWEGAAALYGLFGKDVDPSEMTAEQVQRWLDGAIQAACNISERASDLAEQEEDQPNEH